MPRLVAPVVAAGALRRMHQPVLACPPGLALRPWRGADADAVVDAYADPGIRQWNLQALDRSEAIGWIGQWDQRWQAETDACWAITDAGSAAVVGRIALRDISLEDGLAQVTYWVLPWARGKGAATAAADCVSHWALAELGLHRIELHHSVLNPPSCRVAGKAGFALEGTLRSALLHPDGWHDMHVHARLSAT